MRKNGNFLLKHNEDSLTYLMHDLLVKNVKLFDGVQITFRFIHESILSPELMNSIIEL